MKTALDALGTAIAQWTELQAPLATAIEGLTLYRSRERSELTACMYEPSICVVAQGAKRVVLSNSSFLYDPQHFLISSVHLPAFVEIPEASPERPYLGLVLTLDLQEISALMVDAKVPPPAAKSPSSAMALGTMTAPLLNAFQRLVDLLASGQDIPVLLPVIRREIIYRLLTGDQGERLRQIASAGTQSRQVARAIEYLKDNFSRSMPMDELAAEVGMSTSTFHHHFRAMTDLSPLQFQKQLRLQEARRLMLVEYLDAASAAFQVGYESPSQFNREYSRLFGAPPLRDIRSMRESPGAVERPAPGLRSNSSTGRTVPQPTART